MIVCWLGAVDAPSSQGLEACASCDESLPSCAGAGAASHDENSETRRDPGAREEMLAMHKAAMHTENSIEIEGDVRRIFQLAAQVDNWPQMLPHYRSVQVLQRQNRRIIVEMAAQHGRIPVRWTAVQEVFPYERITYKHIKGFTTGMDVSWSFRPSRGRVHVVIRHDFSLPWPIVGRMVSRCIVGQLFVKPIADKTLAHIKRVAETEQPIGT